MKTPGQLSEERDKGTFDLNRRRLPILHSPSCSWEFWRSGSRNDFSELKIHFFFQISVLTPYDQNPIYKKENVIWLCLWIPQDPV